MHIETGIDQDRETGLSIEGAENVVVEGIIIAVDDLGPRRKVDMDDRGNAIAPSGVDVARNGHVTAGPLVDVANVKNLRGFFTLDNGREGHEFRARKSFV